MSGLFRSSIMTIRQVGCMTALVSTAGLLLAGCDLVAPRIDSTPSVASAPVEAYGPKVFPFFTTEADPDPIAVFQTLVNEYQQLNPDIEIDIVLASPASRGRWLLTWLASGADLGIFEIEPTLMSEWAEAGYLLPLDEVVSGVGEADYVEGYSAN